MKLTKYEIHELCMRKAILRLELEQSVCDWFNENDSKKARIAYDKFLTIFENLDKELFYDIVCQSWAEYTDDFYTTLDLVKIFYNEVEKFVDYNSDDDNYYDDDLPNFYDFSLINYL